MSQTSVIITPSLVIKKTLSFLPDNFSEHHSVLFVFSDVVEFMLLHRIALNKHLKKIMCGETVTGQLGAMYKLDWLFKGIIEDFFVAKNNQINSFDTSDLSGLFDLIKNIAFKNNDIAKKIYFSMCGFELKKEITESYYKTLFKHFLYYCVVTQFNKDIKKSLINNRILQNVWNDYALGSLPQTIANFITNNNLIGIKNE